MRHRLITRRDILLFNLSCLSSSLCLCLSLYLLLLSCLIFDGAIFIIKASVPLFVQKVSCQVVHWEGGMGMVTTCFRVTPACQWHYTPLKVSYLYFFCCLQAKIFARSFGRTCVAPRCRCTGPSLAWYVCLCV